VILDPQIPPGPLKDKWQTYVAHAKLINPANRGKYHIAIVGSGLAGSSAASSLGELGFRVSVFTFHDSARRAHSVAAQGGVNASKNYQNDGDSVWRMFYDTLKGGDFRAREANVYRLAECSMGLIDQAVAQGVPFNREYNGYLSNRSFGGVQVSRTFYARGQTGQQLLLGAYQAMMRQVRLGRVKLYDRHEMLELMVEDNRAKGIVVRDLKSGELEPIQADAVLLATGGYGKIYWKSTFALQSNATAIVKAYKKGAYFGAPSWIQFHPTSLPQSGPYQSKLTLMSESLRNDGRIWVPIKKGDDRHPNDIPEGERDYYLERRYPAFGNLAPRDIASRAAKERIDEGFGVGKMKNAVYLDFSKAISNKGRSALEAAYGNLFDMYRHITGIDAYQEPMLISPAAHFSMGGLWVDYRLMTSISGLFALGEANCADHGANRLGANSLLQACVDGYYIVSQTLMDYFAENGHALTSKSLITQSLANVKSQLEILLSVRGSKTAENYHKELGDVLYANCGLSRKAPSMVSALSALKQIRADFYQNILVPGKLMGLNPELEKAGRVADFLDLAPLLITDALDREESCGAHFREEFQTDDGEPKRNDEAWGFVSAWEYNGLQKPIRHEDVLTFEEVAPIKRSYK
jgi:succinate dehydrogenase / fumarate reductase, flavoprotein subunit